MNDPMCQSPTEMASSLSTSLPHNTTTNKTKPLVFTLPTTMTTMASSSVVMFSFGFIKSYPSNNPIQSTVHLSPFTKKTSLTNLSSSHTISGFTPILFPNTTLLTVVSPTQNHPNSLTVVSAKGYKMKTHKASAKRFRVTGSGKIMRRRAGKQHLNGKKSTKRKLRLSKMQQVDRSDYNNVIGALPYLKVNRAN